MRVQHACHVDACRTRCRHRRRHVLLLKARLQWQRWTQQHWCMLGHWQQQLLLLERVQGVHDASTVRRSATRCAREVLPSRWLRSVICSVAERLRGHCCGSRCATVAATPQKRKAIRTPRIPKLPVTSISHRVLYPKNPRMPYSNRTVEGRRRPRKVQVPNCNHEGGRCGNTINTSASSTLIQWVR